MERYLNVPEAYECELHPQHCDAADLPKMPHYTKAVDELLKSGSVFYSDVPPLGFVALSAKHATETMPAGIDPTYGVDTSGDTKLQLEPRLFTDWLNLSEYNRYVRFATARTAMHSQGALRTPIKNGIALETTIDPASKDPRRAITALVIELPKRVDVSLADSRRRPARVFDLSPYTQQPLDAGIHYTGYPNALLTAAEINEVSQFVRVALYNLTNPLRNE